MYHLATIYPPIKRIQLPLSRDQVMLVMLAVNELLLGLETYFAHLISGTIVLREWIPILFGPISGVLLIIAGLIAIKKRYLAIVIANIIFLSSIVVGLLGAYFHIMRAILPNADLGSIVSIPLLIWAPPILGPFTFALVGFLGISAIWLEQPPNSGTLRITSKFHLSLPLSKTRAYFLLIGMGSLATVISSVLDHARTDFSNPWLWLPTSVGIFASVVSVMLGVMEHPTKGDLVTFAVAMILMILIGVIGAILHYYQDVTSQATIVIERFLRGAPILAPLLFSDMGTLGLIVLLDPIEKGSLE